MQQPVAFDPSPTFLLGAFLSLPGSLRQGHEFLSPSSQEKPFTSFLSVRAGNQLSSSAALGLHSSCVGVTFDSVVRERMAEEEAAQQSRKVPSSSQQLEFPVRDLLLPFISLPVS